jgi:hypothetical protein
VAVSEDILQALATNLAAVPGCPPPAVREWPLVLPVDYPLPACLISMNPAEGERVGRVVFGGATRWHYPVFVILLWASARAAEAGRAERLQLRQDVRNELFRPLLAATGQPAAEVYNVEIDPRAAADVAAAMGANVIASGFRVVYHTTEQALFP